MNLPEFSPQQPGIELQSKEEISHEYRSLFSPLSLSLEGPPRNWHPLLAHPPTRKVSSLCLFIYNHKMEGMESKVYDELLNEEQKQQNGDEEEHLDYRRRKHSSWSIGRSIHLFITTVLALALIYQQWRFSRQQICHRGFPTDYGKKDGIPEEKKKLLLIVEFVPF